MTCARPFMMIQDLGVTFGRANKFNEGGPGSANLAEWSKTPVWQDENLVRRQPAQVGHRHARQPAD